MEEKLLNNEQTQWFSTYGVITAERILGRYNITLSSNELITAIKTPTSFYQHLLHVPLKNVLNGIVLQQANDYHIYVQKLFIDYLLSGESSKNAEAQGAFTRESLEEERKRLVHLGEDYHKKNLDQDRLIASSQADFIKITREWNKYLETSLNLIKQTLAKHRFDTKKSVLRKAINSAFIYCDLNTTQDTNNEYIFIDKVGEIIQITFNDAIKQELVAHLAVLFEVTRGFNSKVRGYLEQAMEIGEQANSFRTQFYETILRVIELINLLPDYKINPDQDKINREPLYFDKSIGEK